jgi:hypothetical protein
MYTQWLQKKRRSVLERPFYCKADSNRGSRTPYKVENHGNDCQYQQYVDKKRADVEDKKTSQPQQQQHKSES